MQHNYSAQQSSKIAVTFHKIIICIIITPDSEQTTNDVEVDCTAIFENSISSLAFFDFGDISITMEMIT